jgi:hypothetical protein
MGVNKLDRRAVSAANFLKPDGTSAIPGAATTAVAGTVKKLPTQANSTATDVAGLVVDFNALLTKLRTAGILT